MNLKILKTIFIFAIICTTLFKFSSIHHSLPSDYVEDLQIKHEGLVLWVAWKKGLIKRQLVIRHKYSLLGPEIVATWTALNTYWMHGEQNISRTQFTVLNRFLMIMAATLFIVVCSRLAEHRGSGYIAGTLGAITLLPFMFSLMIRPHLLNMTFLTTATFLGLWILKSPRRFKLILFGLSSGLAISTLFPSVIILWFALFILKSKKIYRHTPWYLAGLVLGLLPGYIDQVLLLIHPSLESFKGIGLAHLDWTNEAKNFKPDFSGIKPFFWMILGHEPLLAIGVIAFIVRPRSSAFISACLWTLIPGTIALLLVAFHSRFWLFLFPFYIVIASVGWWNFITSWKPARYVWVAAVLMSLTVQLRTAWLINHDMRPDVEKNILRMLPDNSTLILDPYGPRFNNYNFPRDQFKLIKSSDLTKEDFNALKKSNDFIFYVINSKKTPIDWVIKNGKLVKSWSVPGDPTTTQDLPNTMYWPWWDIWTRSRAGPNCHLLLLPSSSSGSFKLP